jgi:hypothetical protein
MSHWGFIIAAYAVTATGTIAMVWASWRAMRRAERDVEELGKRP